MFVVGIMGFEAFGVDVLVLILQFITLGLWLMEPNSIRAVIEGHLSSSISDKVIRLHLLIVFNYLMLQTVNVVKFVD